LGARLAATEETHLG
jgi:hypothetical protein